MNGARAQHRSYKVKGSSYLVLSSAFIHSGRSDFEANRVDSIGQGNDTFGIRAWTRRISEWIALWPIEESMTLTQDGDRKANCECHSVSAFEDVFQGGIRGIRGYRAYDGVHDRADAWRYATRSRHNHVAGRTGEDDTSVFGDSHVELVVVEYHRA